MAIFEVFPIFFHFFLNLLRAFAEHLVTDVFGIIRCFRKKDFKMSQVNESKIWPNELELIVLSERLVITVRYCYHRFEKFRGFSLYFQKIGDKKFLKCNNLESEELWVEELDSSADLIQLGVQEFRAIVHDYQEEIKKLNLHITRSRSQTTNIDFGITKMSSLEELKIIGEYDVCELLAKTPNNLKKLFVTVRNPEYAEILKACEKLYQVQNVLSIPNIQLNNAQFLQLSASRVRMNNGQLTEDNIYDFVKSWRNGKTGKKWERYEWILTGNFDSIRLFRKFGEMHDGVTNKRINISHNSKDGKTATLEFIGVSQNYPVLFFEIGEN